TGAGGLTKLSVWWLRLGIRLERIAPGKPQQNGRQERFHRTLKAETTRPPRAHLRALFLSSSLAHEDVELRYEPNREQWHVVFGPLSLGWIAEVPKLTFRPTRGRMADQVESEVFAKLSGMSPD